MVTLHDLTDLGEHLFRKTAESKYSVVYILWLFLLCTHIKINVVFLGVLKPPGSSPSGMPPIPVSSQYGANIQQNGAHPNR